MAAVFSNQFLLIKLPFFIRIVVYIEVISNWVTRSVVAKGCPIRVARLAFLMMMMIRK